MSQETNQSTNRESKPKAKSDLFDQFFSVWEKRTSEYFERLLRNPAFLNTMGGLMNSGYKNKIVLDRAMSTIWRNLNLPNKQDQERTLHLLNELHSRIYDLEEKLSVMKKDEEPAADRANGSAKSRPRRASPDLKTAGAE